MKKGITFCNDMVLACIDLRKGRTTRIINPQPTKNFGPWIQELESGDICIDHINNKIFRLTESKGRNKRAAGELTPVEIKSRYQVGDELYVKEAYRIKYANLSDVFYEPRVVSGYYVADDFKFQKQLSISEWKLFCKRKHKFKLTSGRFMYKSLARIFLPPIERITVQRPQDLTPQDLWSKGLQFGAGAINQGYLQWKNLWNRLHGDGAYDRNEWCFVYWWDSSKIEVRR